MIKKIKIFNTNNNYRHHKNSNNLLLNSNHSSNNNNFSSNVHLNSYITHNKIKARFNSQNKMKITK